MQESTSSEKQLEDEEMPPKRYEVTVYENVYYSTDVQVEAYNEEEAAEVALEQFDRNDCEGSSDGAEVDSVVCLDKKNQPASDDEDSVSRK